MIDTISQFYVFVQRLAIVIFSLLGSWDGDRDDICCIRAITDLAARYTLQALLHAV